MAIISAQTTFNVEATDYLEEILDLVLLPEAPGLDALRFLRYPGDLLPPLIYEQNPDRWENFDTVPLTGRPLSKTDLTLEGTRTAQWPGYVADRPVRETWKGDERRLSASLYFFRRLWEYWANPPADGYITWWPQDRTSQGYNIHIEDIAVAGTDTVNLDYIATRNGYLVGDLTFTFRILGEVV